MTVTYTMGSLRPGTVLLNRLNRNSSTVLAVVPINDVVRVTYVTGTSRIVTLVLPTSEEFSSREWLVFP